MTVLERPIAVRRWRFALERLRRSNVAKQLIGHRLFSVGVVIFSVIVVLSAFPSVFAPKNPNAIDYLHRLNPPSMRHLFGTDRFGRDVMSRVLSGGSSSLLIGLAVVIVSGLFGTILGSIAGYARTLDGVIMRMMDAMMAFPVILLGIALSAALGPSKTTVIIALSMAYIPRTARLVRASVMTLRDSDFVLAAKSIGAKDTRILGIHILGNSLSPLLVQFTFIFAVAVLAEAALSFIGAGPPPPAPTWGNIISEGRTDFIEAPWISLLPGLFIALTVLSLNLIGDGLRDVLDPRLNRERML